MRSTRAIQIGLLIVACGLPASAADQPDAGEPTSQPASQPDNPDPDVVQWRAHCDMDDGRRFITDGGLLLESRYIPGAPVPEKSVPPQAAQRLLQTNTDHEFSLADLNRKPDGHYLGPGSIQLNRKYIDLLRASSLKPTLRFGAKGPNDPVLILDGQKVVGVVMPMKT